MRQLTRLAPAPAVVALAVPEDEPEIVAYAEAGVAGFVTREETLDDLLAAVKTAACGEIRCSARTAAFLLRRVTTLAREHAGATPASLTTREREIAALLDEGLSNKQIAHRLHIELPTVKNHVHHILGKLAVNRRGEAVARLREQRGTSTP